MSKLVILVPEGRRFAGRAALLGANGALRLGPLPLLATASGWAARRHGNPTRDWRRPYGHPPTGSFFVTGSLPPRAAPRAARLRRFGPLGALVLTPFAGNAAEAARAGRQRFLVHGGPPDQAGRLRPTFGGFRFSDPGLASLLRAINDAFAQGDSLSSVEFAETTQPSDRGNRAGRLRPVDPTSGSHSSRALPMHHASFVALGLGALGWRDGGPLAPPTSRRDFLGLALLIVGAAGISACGSGDDEATDCADCAPSPVGTGGGPGGDGGGSSGGYVDNGGGGGGSGGDDTGGDVGGGGG